MKTLRKIALFVKNVKKYWGVLWSDRDYDYQYLVNLLIFKLEAMHDFFSDDSKTMTDMGEQAVQVEEVIGGLKGIAEEPWVEQVHRDFNVKLNEFGNPESFHNVAGVPDGELFPLYVQYQKAYMDYFFSLLAQHLLEWAD